MNTSSKQIQTQSQTQVQTLSPQQILAVKLLELPAVEIEERVRAEILDNPAIEQNNYDNNEESNQLNNSEEDHTENISSEDLSLGDYRSEDDIPDYKLQSNNGIANNRAEDIPFSDAVSFYEYLKEQLSEQDIDDDQKEIAEYIIGSLDNDGLLRKPLEMICDELAIYRAIYATVEDIEHVLLIIQEFDPAGIGARSLQECLLIQIKRKESCGNRELQYEIIKNCFDEFTHKNREKIIQKLNITEDDYDEAYKELTRLNPRPGSSLGESLGKSLQQITPDFIVETFDDETIDISLNNMNVPELKVSSSFSQMFDEFAHNKENQSKETKDAFIFLKQKMDSAQGFINAIKQRQQTLMKSMKAIVDFQHSFFINGDETALKPMILKDIAEITGLDISTISRVSNNKYVQTNFGIFPLKFFFSDGYTTENGEELSVREIKIILKECVDSEDKTKPLSDDELAELLKKRGYPIARRTVAKYRQLLNIPIARLRRR